MKGDELKTAPVTAIALAGTAITGAKNKGIAMEACTLGRESSQQRTVCRVIFTVDRTTGKVISAEPVVDTDEELAQIEPFIEACLILSALIQPVKNIQKAA